MPNNNKPPNRIKQKLIIGLCLVVMCVTIATALATKKLFEAGPVGGPTQNHAQGATVAVAQSNAPQQQTSGQFDVSRNVIAGGGGSSSGGTLQIEGTIGQPAVGTAMSGGQFSQTGGFWQATSGATPAPSPTPSPSPTPTPTSTIQFSASSYNVGEGDPKVTITVTRTGVVSAASSVSFTTSDLAAAQNCNVLTGVASSRCDYEINIATVRFAPGETSRTLSVFIIDDSYLEGTETFSAILSNPSGSALGGQSTTNLVITDNDLVNGINPIDNADFYVRQHYLDFLNREPDPGGLAFWTNEITSCGADTQCIEVKRINVSAAFYLSIEFQETGYLMERLYQTAYGSANGTSLLGGVHQLAVPVVRLTEFLPDSQEIGQGVVVGQPGWEQVLESNKQSFIAAFVERPRFTTAFPVSFTSDQFVDTMNANAGNPLSPGERNQLVSDLNTSAKTRAQVLRAIAEDSDLVSGESNRAFVLMQYFGYLRRNPNDPQDTDHTGYDFWLTKLNQFNGNFVNAEMVKAFIFSGEYRQRFGP